MRLGRRNGPLALLATAALVAAAGCGSDESGQGTTAAQVSIPSVTSPLASTTAPETIPAGPGKEKGGPPAGGSSGECAIPATYQDFEFNGIDCAAALAVAGAWEENANRCNTIDNPDKPEGYNRTCELEGYTCDAKRDVHSDGRFVSCTQGGASIRFTWFPA